MTTTIKTLITSTLLAAVLTATIPFVVHAATFNVSNSSELQSAINQASGGDTILLASGNYGALDLSGERFNSMVTIKSANSGSPATIGNVDIRGGSNIRLEGLTIVGDNKTVDISDSSNIQIVNNDISGASKFSRSNPSKSQLGSGFAVDANNVSGLLIDNNYVHDASIAVVRVGNSTNPRVTNNRCDWVSDDCFKMNNLDGLVFEGNIGAANWYSPSGAHPDFMQSSGGVQNGTFRNNVAIQQTGKFQGLFFGGDQNNHQNNIIENNLIVTSMPNGILVNPSSNTVRNNTVLRRLPLNIADFEMVRIVGESDGGNIMVGKESQAGINGDGDLVLQAENPNGLYYYDDYFRNADNPGTLTYADFQIIAGSLAEDYGAVNLTDRLVSSGDTGIPPGGIGGNPGAGSGGGSGGIEGLLTEFEAMSDAEKAALYERIFGVPPGSQIGYEAPEGIEDILSQLLELLRAVQQLQMIVLNNPGLASPQIVQNLNDIAIQLAVILRALR